MLVFSHKCEKYGLVVTQSFEDHNDLYLERPPDALEVCQISLCPGDLEGFIVGTSLCCPFQLNTAVICEVCLCQVQYQAAQGTAPSAAQNGLDVLHQNERKLSK